MLKVLLTAFWQLYVNFSLFSVATLFCWDGFVVLSNKNMIPNIALLQYFVEYVVRGEEEQQCVLKRMIVISYSHSQESKRFEREA